MIPYVLLVRATPPYTPRFQEMLEIVERGKEGAVLFSLGTAAETHKLNPQKVDAIFKAFAKFPELQFIVKVSPEDEMSRDIGKGIKNIEIRDWLPQTDLLGGLIFATSQLSGPNKGHAV